MLKILSTLLLLSTSLAYADRFAHQFAAIDTCYHWIQRDQLQVKIDYAEKNSGALYFYGGSVIYCWRSPLGAQSPWEDHGDELIRIKFKPGVKIVHLPRIYNHQNASHQGDVIYSNDNAWQEYTITPGAIESWSIYHPHTAVEMKAELQYHSAGLTNPNDVFPPVGQYNVNWLKSSAPHFIQNLLNFAGAGHTKIYGQNKDQHFQTAYALPWQKFLDRTKFAVITPKIQKIKIKKAFYGSNVVALNASDVSDKAAQFCDDKVTCEYKVHKKFIGDPAPDQLKDFKIEWTCGNEAKVRSLSIDAPADNKTLNLECMD